MGINTRRRSASKRPVTGLAASTQASSLVRSPKAQRRR